MRHSVSHNHNAESSPPREFGAYAPVTSPTTTDAEKADHARREHPYRGMGKPAVSPPRHVSPELLLQLAKCLDYSPADDRAASMSRGKYASWSDLATYSIRELLAPTLWVRLREKGLADSLPAQTASLLRRCHAINTVRNARIAAELVEAVGAMNAAGLQPVILKGAVDFVSPRYGDSGARILRDIDMLVSKADLPRAIHALKSIGYVEAPREATKFVTYAADLTRSGNLVGIDLQFYISGQRDLLSPDDALAHAVPQRFGDVLLRTLSPQHQIIHNLLHSEVQDRGGDIGFVWLRQLLDLAALWRQHGETIDWGSIQRHFAGHGLAKLVERRLYMVHRLLALPLPEEIPATRTARLHFRRCLLQMRWRWLDRTAGIVAVFASAFDARLLDVMYGSGLRGWEKWAWRVRHGGRLWSRHSRDLPNIIRRRLTKYE